MMTPKPVLKSKDAAELSSLLSSGVNQCLFPAHLELIPGMHEMYELQLAHWESQLLSDGELIRNSAYFSCVGGVFTRHYLMCSGEPVRLPQHASSRLRSFFQTKQFKTGYATHGLFPYRGKFHPQMIKGLLNVMGLKPGEIVLDPMMGSGTVLIEARLMGIRSVGIEASPFCTFMVQSKLDGLTVPLGPLRAALANSRSCFEYFTKMAGQPRHGSKARWREGTLFLQEEIKHYTLQETNLPSGCEAKEVFQFLLLCYLDSAGYSERSDRKSPYTQFRAILERYFFVTEKIQGILAGTESEFASAAVIRGDARHLPLKDSSVDGILFSPPYSFAIDYLENDSFHLNFLGANHQQLREIMVGLRGKTLLQKFNLYKADMDTVISECARVLRAGRICTVVVGTNSNQLSKLMGVSREQVQGIDELLVEIAARHGFRCIRKLDRQIVGLANTMRTEFIVLLQRK